MSQSIRFALVVIALVAVLGGFNALVHRRVSAAFMLATFGRRALAAFFALGLAGIFAGRFLPSAFWARLVSGLGWVVEIGVLIAGLFLLAVGLLVALGDRVLRAGKWGKTSTSPTSAPIEDASSPEAARVNLLPLPFALSRRDLLSRASATAALAIGGGSATYGALSGRHDYVVEEVPIRLARLPRQLDGFTIAQLSDLHLGLFVGDWEMARAVELVKRARPDVIAITGDMIDHQIAYAEQLGRLVRMLSEVAPVLAVPGNHDHYAGVDAVLAAVRRGGGTVLLNQSVRVGEQRIVVAGVDDLWARRRRLGRGPDLDAALSNGVDDAPCVLLAHQPEYFEESASRVDLQLSGHTHGGQFNLGVRPAGFVLPHGWVAGRYEVGPAQLYVNRGFGTAGPPARLGAPPEVTRLVLTV